ncbi:MAG: hypothetical protein ACT4OP_01875 [Actinomycetota bacterium]
MDRDRIDQALAVIETRLSIEADIDLKALGFWRIVGRLRRDSGMAAEFADRVGKIDREIFKRTALLVLPVALGTVLAVLASLVGLFLIGLAYSLEDVAQALSLLIGTGIVMVGTHGLAHLVVGTFQGMRFTNWFVASARRPQPGVKVDYASYLRTPPRRRAFMHASGAIVTKLVPFVALGAGWAMDAENWVLAILAIVAVLQLITDMVWSTKASDWKKYRREMAAA